MPPDFQRTGLAEKLNQKQDTAGSGDINGEMLMFKKEDSQAIKGIAILMMLWHHCFLDGRYEEYDIIFSPLSENAAVSLANLCNICVSLFAYISGYGLYLSLEKYDAEKRAMPNGFGSVL